MFLYNTILEKSIPSELTPLPTSAITEFVKTVKKMDDDAHEKIYALVKYHHNVQDNGNDIYPYGMKKSAACGLRLDFNVLPIKLQYILLEFVKLHSIQTQA
jgi:hypothetical protein